MYKALEGYLAEKYGARCAVLGGEDFLSCVVNKRRAEGYRSAIFAVFPYYSGGREGKISLYARFEDYHEVITRALCEAAKLYLPPDINYRACADVSPLNEVRGAALSGLGCVGKNGLLITPEFGSYGFIGELMLSCEADTSPGEISSFLVCGRCAGACPTGAIDGRGECLSSLTQKKRLTPEEEAVIAKCGMEWGCDRCQTVCPMNKNAKKTAIPEFSGMTVSEITEFDTAGLTDGEITEKYAHRAFTWRGAAVIRRNEAIVSGGAPLAEDRSPDGGN